MRIVVVGAGGVGAAFASVVSRRDFFEQVTIADLDPARAEAAVASVRDGRFAAAQVDASSQAAVVALLRARRADVLLNATDPRFNPQLFAAAFEARATYLDLALSLSEPHPERPNELPGVLLGERQFAEAERWRSAGLLALLGIGVEPGLSDVFARYAADELFAEIDEVAVRDGSNLVVEGYEFAPTFSIWTTIEECLNPPLLWSAGRGHFTTEPFSEPELFDFPDGIGPNGQRRARGGRARPACDRRPAGDVQVRARRRVHRDPAPAPSPRARLRDPVRVRGVEVAPRDVLAAALPDPARLGERMSGKTCAGTLVTGTGKDGAPRACYLYHVVDHAETMRTYGHQAVVLQTALNPAVALELISAGTWRGPASSAPRSCRHDPSFELLAAYGEPHRLADRDPRLA